MAAALKESAGFTPASLGGDLPKDEQLAYQQGHDADFPSDETAAQQQRRPQQGHTQTRITERSKDVGLENSDGHRNSETSSIGEPSITRDPEKGEPPVASAEHDPNIVTWDGDDDPANPMNWSTTAKWSNIALLSLLTLLTPLASSFFAPAVPAVLETFGSHSNLLAAFVVSIYVLGYAVGPLIVAPMSELYGRVIVYHISNVGFLAFTAGCAVAPSMNSLIVLRFFQGCWGAAPVTIGGASIADMIAAEKRGAALSVWALGPLLGPTIGPVAGGFLSTAVGWRWIFWVLLISTAAFALLGLVVLRETYAPVILKRKAQRLRKETRNPHLTTALENHTSASQLFRRAFVRPAKLMFLSPICALMSLYMATIYGILYLLFTTFTFVFEGPPYHFSTSTVGLVYLGIGIGNLVGLAALGSSNDRIMRRLANKHNNGTLKPEYRLPTLMYAGPLVPIGLFLYGWTAQYGVHWIVPLIGTFIVGTGLIACFMCINTYLIDAFALYAASAMAANTVLRSILGALFPLFGLQMYSALGLGWGNSLLAFIGVALCPIPWVFYHYGERIRTSPRWQVKF